MEKKTFDLTPFQSLDGRFYVISGRRYSGKTTLVKHLLKQIKPDISLIFSSCCFEWKDYEKTLRHDLKSFQKLMSDWKRIATFKKGKCAVVIDGLDREIADIAKQDFFRILTSEMRHYGLTLIITFDPEPNRVDPGKKYLAMDPLVINSIYCIFLTQPIEDERRRQRFYKDFVYERFPGLDDIDDFTDFCRTFYSETKDYKPTKKIIAFSSSGLQWIEN